mmetsp:Transcript_58522/g.96922  ORF Transcript_58522/g.96922 Transcript_58522/m.96922 type:complete len:146 (+) Transcript_58522:62-499(+)|eukprot:CAMPEP_0202694700 /NCGR_PEP_ID=MMETSP1385-20130828/8494_1 /ASSEMBLY_ACC=CAM_ASM_000861 /TAXON_ID=933848 /ORGANISM="Elphidium margaritaceum" /LENGTH=145 /DNA_ID=CAMNT_0049350593 /DNA_START=41 /DNA_END=478 /DNA_ORIENTATION=+
MPRIRRKQTKYPKGFEVLEDKLDEFEERMREAVLESDDGKRKSQSTWPIIKIHHQRSRYIYEMYKEKKIKKPVYEFCIREKYADGNLIAKWKKAGFERLCCMQCIQAKSHTYKTTCICRVPKADLPKDKVIECIQCGCRGCASGD